MTYEEFIEKYGEVEVKFYHYYKFEFAFKQVDGDLIVSWGGDPGDIYREHVYASTTMKVKDGWWNHARIEGETLYDTRYD